MLHCDWCGKPIESREYATIEPGGYFIDGKPIRLPIRTYHTSYQGESGRPYDSCCASQALRLIDGEEFRTPDAGMRWKLVPASEVHNAVYEHAYTEAVLGITPLIDLGLTDAMYKRVTGRGVFTVEHLVDARLRGETLAIAPKTLAKLDAILIERNLLPMADTQSEERAS